MLVEDNKTKPIRNSRANKFDPPDNFTKRLEEIEITIGKCRDKHLQDVVLCEDKINSVLAHQNIIETNARDLIGSMPYK